MARYLIEEDTLKKIADAIRSKKGTIGTILVSQMDQEISGIVIPEIPEIPEVVLSEVRITPTGIEKVITPADGVDGFKKVTVSGDENLIPENIKSGVVIYGVEGNLEASEKIELIELSITSNGDYVAPEGFGYSKVVVNVANAGNGGFLKIKDAYQTNTKMSSIKKISPISIISVVKEVE